MSHLSERALAYRLATPIDESQYDQVSGGGGGEGGHLKWPHIIVTGDRNSPDLIIEN